MAVVAYIVGFLGASDYYLYITDQSLAEFGGSKMYEDGIGAFWRYITNDINSYFPDSGSRVLESNII